MIVLIALTTVPVLLYIGFGAYALWKTNLLIWLWWILPVGWALTYLVVKLWPAQPHSDAVPPTGKHWTPRDSAAAEIVLRYQQHVDSLSPNQLTDAQFYVHQFQKLSHELATYYHPDAADPFSSLTVPELAAAIRLVADDLEQIVLNSLPGSRLLTVNQWRSFGKTPKWANQIRNSIWAGSILINPLNIARYGLSRRTIDKVSSGIQSELLATIYLRFIRQVGFYLIEMNSGRLRGGADEYRSAFEAAGKAMDDPKTSQSHTITIGFIGQTSAGKSSLIDGITKSPRTESNPQQHTKSILRHAHTINPTPTSPAINIVLMDCPGYNPSGTSNRQMNQIQTVIAESDIILLALDAATDERSADVETLQKITGRFEKIPHLKCPPIIAVLTHIDLLPPADVWSPPCDLETPKSPKEKFIAAAIEHNDHRFGNAIAGTVAVCCDEKEDRQWGIEEQLLPMLIAKLEEGKSAAMLNAFESTIDRGWGKQVWAQIATGGKQLAKMWLQERINRAGKK
jgi:predicted GTPase